MKLEREEIVRQAIENEDFTAIYKMYRDEIYYHVMKKTTNKSLVEDITSDVFIKLYDKLKLKLYDTSKGQFNTWLYTLANNTIIDYFRSSENNKQLKTTNVESFYTDDEKSTFDFIAPTSSHADKDILAAETQKNIVAAFHDLKPKYRRIAVLYFISGYKYSEIATMLNIPEGTVKGMLNRARTKLQESLKVVKTA